MRRMCGQVTLWVKNNVVACLVLGAFLAVFLVTAVNSKGFYHWDEHYQIIEFASLKLGKSQLKDMPWEYTAQIRPALQPAIAFAEIKALRGIGLSSPFVQVMLLRVLSALLSFTALLFVFLALIKRNDTKPALSAILVFSLWFLPFIGVRFSSETWSAACVALAVSLLLLDSEKRFHVLAAAALLGLAFLFRFQSAIFIVSILAWAIVFKKLSVKHLLLSIGVITIVLLLGTCIDKWFYGNWTLTPLNYFLETMVYNNGPSFGTMPWYFYLTSVSIWGVLPVGMLIILVLITFVVIRPKSLVTWVIVPFVLVHCLIGHKELRFLFPVVFILPFVLHEVLIDTKWLQRFATPIVVILFLLNVPCMIYMAYRPAHEELAYVEFMNKHKLDSKIYFSLDNPAEIYSFYTIPEENWYYRKVEPCYFKTLDSLSTDCYVFLPNIEYVKVPEEFRGRLHAVNPQPRLVKKYFECLTGKKDSADFSRTLYVYSKR